MPVREIIRYVYVTLGVAFLFFVPALFIRRFYLRNKGRLKTISVKKEVAIDLFIFYILCLYQITALRFGGIGWNIENMLQRNTRVNLIPIVALWNWVNKCVWWHLFYNAMGNWIWFVPFGTLLPAIFIKRRNLWSVMALGACVSTSIEVLQFILCTGVTDVDDIILNTLGAGCGYFIWLVLDKLRKQIKQKRT